MNVYNKNVETLRPEEYPSLEGSTYLDHNASTIPARSLNEAIAQDLTQNLYGNPRSSCGPSRLSEARIDEIRQNTLHFFHANPTRFDIVFTANATAAIKLVGECFHDYARYNPDSNGGGLFKKKKDQQGFWLGFHRDSHTSVIGLREYADGKHRCLNSNGEVKDWMASETIAMPEPGQPALFTYPGQSNMTGRRLPLKWSNELRNSNKKDTYTLLDAASLAACCQLELDRDQPDFTVISFPKIFGQPDIGALIIRKASAHMLQKRRYFGGGTTGMVIAVDGTWHARNTESVHAQLEDGSLPYHAIIALGHALEVHKRLFTSMTRVSSHMQWLGQYAYNSMMNMFHSNSVPVFKIYTDHDHFYGNAISQGPVIAFNILRRDGSVVGYADVEEAADKERVYVRSGGLCNPGGIATYLGWKEEDWIAVYERGHREFRPLQEVEGRATGVVRISVGPMSTRQDVENFLYFVYGVYVRGVGQKEEEMVENGESSETKIGDSFEDEIMGHVTARMHMGSGEDLVIERDGLNITHSWAQNVVMFSPKEEGPGGIDIRGVS